MNLDKLTDMFHNEIRDAVIQLIAVTGGDLDLIFEHLNTRKFKSEKDMREWVHLIKGGNEAEQVMRFLLDYNLTYKSMVTHWVCRNKPLTMVHLPKGGFEVYTNLYNRIIGE